MIGHLGNRVSALLDGQLSAKDAEEAWSHVYLCHTCRDLVEREGWVKTRLAGLAGPSDRERHAPSGLKGSLLSMPPGDMLLADVEARSRSRRGAGVVMLGGGAVGAAMLGVLVIGLAPNGGAPSDRRPPPAQVNTTVPATGGTTVSTNLTTVLRTPMRRMLP